MNREELEKCLEKIHKKEIQTLNIVREEYNKKRNELYLKYIGATKSTKYIAFLTKYFCKRHCAAREPELWYHYVIVREMDIIRFDPYLGTEDKYFRPAHLYLKESGISYLGENGFSKGFLRQASNSLTVSLEKYSACFDTEEEAKLFVESQK